MTSFFNSQTSQGLDHFSFREMSHSNSIDPVSLDNQHYEHIIKDGKSLYRCTFSDCGKSFKFKSEMNRHLLTHFPTRPFACSIEGCGKSFKRQDALQSHLRIHSNDKPYACEVPDCNFKSASKSGMHYHLLKHESQKPYVCSFLGCSSSFLTKTQLKQHERSENFHKRYIDPEQIIINESSTSPRKIRKNNAFLSRDLEPNNIMTKPQFATKLLWETRFLADEADCHHGKTQIPKMENDVLKLKVEDYNSLIDKFLREFTSNTLHDSETVKQNGTQCYHQDTSQAYKTEDKIIGEENEFRFLNL